jgi:prophage regulatory protein
MDKVGAVPEVGYLRLPAVLAVFPVSRSTWWEGVRTGKYPKSYKIAPRCTAWKAADIRRLLGDGEMA